jgi:TonB family protein
MFDGLLITKDQTEMKRGLLSVPLALIAQVTIISTAVLWGVFSSIELPPPMSIPIFSAPPSLAPPPPAGNSQSASRSHGAQKPAAAAKADPKALVEPQREPVKANETAGADDGTAVTEEGADNGASYSGTGVHDRGGVDFDRNNVRLIYQSGEVTAPRLVFSPPPEYPALALRLGIKGKVDVEMVVDENGSVETVNILSSSNKMFNDAVVSALKKWRFTSPVDRKGQKVAVYYRKTIAFNF